MIRYRISFFALAFGVMAAAGWLLGENSIKSSPPATAARSRQSSRPARVAPGFQDEITKRLATIRATRTPDERTRATIDLALSLPSADFATWLDDSRFTSREGMDLMLFTHILIERWENEDPEGFLLWSYKNYNGKSDHLRATWAKSEPQRLLAFFQKHPDYSNEIDALSEIAEFHPDLALRRFQEIITAGLVDTLGVETGDLVRSLAVNSPAALAAILNSLPDGIRLEAESFLVRQRMRTSFSTELDLLRERPDGLELLKSILKADEAEPHAGPALSDQFVDQLANLPASWHPDLLDNLYIFMNRHNAIKWLNADLANCGFDAAEISKLRVAALRSLATERLEFTLQQMAILDIPPDARQDLIVDVFGHINPTQPQKYEELLALLTTDEDRQKAREIFQPDRPRTEVAKISSPAEWLTAFENDKENSFDYLLMLRDWEPGKISALTSRFDSLPADQKFKTAQALVTKLTPLEGDVLGYLLRQPWDATLIDNNDPFARPITGSNEEIKVRLATSYILPLARKNPESAGQWISALPEGQPKLWAAKNLQSLWSQYDPEAAGRWMKSLPAETRAQVGSLKMEANTEH